MGEAEYGKERLMQGQSLIYDRTVWYNIKYYETKGGVPVRYTLMHKDIPVADLILDEATSAVQKVCDIHYAEHLPVGVLVKRGAVDRAALNTWWIDRSIPASRSGVRKALETLELPNTRLLLTKSMGLSLSDQYWIRPQGSDIQWAQINFFTNDFSEDIGDILLGKAPKGKDFSFHSPDNTSDGFLKKRWKIINGARCLLKAGSAPFMQQPFNEVIASAVCRRLDIPYVPYELCWDDGLPFSVCQDFITPDTELVSAWRVMQTRKKDNSTSVYRHFLNCCETLGVPGMVHAMDQMIVLDYLIANEDRHQNNFGLIREANTLEWLGAAPIFDSGSSLGYDKLTGQILSGKGVECKPLKKTHEEQLALVTDLSWIDFDALRGLEDEIAEILAPAGEYLDQDRRKAIMVSIQQRIEHLQDLALSQRQTADFAENDVAEDIAEDYQQSGPTMNMV